MKEWRKILRRRLAFIQLRLREREQAGTATGPGDFDATEVAALKYVLEELLPPNRDAMILVKPLNADEPHPEKQP